MTARTVVVKTMDGTAVHIPNRTVLDGAITNYTAGSQRRTTIEVGLAYDTDLATAVSIMAQAVKETPGVSAEPEPEALIHEFADSTINAAVRYWHDPKLRSGWTTRHSVAVSVKNALDVNGIEIAFPQRVLWHGDEGESSGLDSVG